MLFAILALHLSAQGGASPPRPQRTVVRDSIPPDSARRNAPRRLPVTAAVLASAFHDASARDLFARARVARLAQDSSLRSYDAKVRQRTSVGVGIGSFGRDRLVYRQESSARVQWQRGSGVRIDMTGARVAIPVLSENAARKQVQPGATDDLMSPIPYFPASEGLWLGTLAARAEVDENSFVNPLAGGAEAYYTYASGDSVSFRLPDGLAVQLRELKVRPRKPLPNVVVGSLWFDTQSGRLVRAAYRPSVALNMFVSVSSDDTTAVATKRANFILRSVIAPNTAEISAIAVEYGLYEGRFWLPRHQSMEGVAHVLLARVPVKIEHAFSYASVNAALDLPVIQVDTTVAADEPHRERPPPGLDSAARRKWSDSTLAVYRAAVKARNDSIAAGISVGSMRQCDTSDTRVVMQYRYDAQPVQVRIPCNTDKLTSSPDLPASIYDAGEEIFGAADANRMIADALSMAAQAPISLGALPPARYQVGPSMTRYNRVEGFSTGVLVEQELGGGLVAGGRARLGAADHQLNVEASLARTNLSTTVRFNAYNRLVSANDWGSPLSFRSSLAAFLFGRDEGFYYRASGAELLWATERGPRLEWRAFGERQRTALQQASYSVGGTFVPNIAAARVTSTGAAVRWLRTDGLDPRGVRLFTDLRFEGAGGDSTYGRGALDVTLSRDIVGPFGAALTVAGGSTIGEVPSQRRWFLGGTQTVRGQSPDTAQSGNAFWLGRMELAAEGSILRTSLFGDLGWAGDRRKMGEIGRPLSGVGIGWSVLDGLVRFDVARGLYPRRQTRVSFYFDARF